MPIKKFNANSVSGGLVSGATVSSSAPSAPSNGALWLNSSTGTLLTYYDSGTTTQWLQPVGPAGAAGAAGATGVFSGTTTQQIVTTNTTPSTNTTTGALIVGGGAGIAGNLYAGNISVAGEIESTVTGFKFPDATIQNSAVSTAKVIAMAIVFGG